MSLLRALVCLPPVIILVCLCESSATMADEKENKKPDAKELLKTFRSEFVAITPGQDKFPAEFDFGPIAGGTNKAVRTTLTENFEISKFETYQVIYEAVVGSNPSRWKGTRNSVDSATIEGATDFCQKATQLMREAKLIEADQIVRLPTEAEWEYCCKAGTTTEYSFGDKARREGDTGNKASMLAEYGWHLDNSPGNDPEVGVLKPNPWGLYDMHGYIWELCADHWTDSLAEAATTPHQPHRAGDDTMTFAMRGGSWKDKFTLLRSSSRREHLTLMTDDSIGFRCVIAKEEKPREEPPAK